MFDETTCLYKSLVHLHFTLDRNNIHFHISWALVLCFCSTSVPLIVFFVGRWRLGRRYVSMEKWTERVACLKSPLLSVRRRVGVRCFCLITPSTLRSLRLVIVILIWGYWDTTWKGMDCLGAPSRKVIFWVVRRIRRYAFGMFQLHRKIRFWMQCLCTR